MFPTLLHFFWSALQVFTAFSLMVPAILCVLYFVRRYVKKPLPPDDELHEEKDYAIIVSVSEPMQNIQAVLHSLLQLNYSNYIIYVVGNYSAAIGKNLNSDRIVYLRTTAAHHTQLRLHRFAIESFKRPHTHVAILDGNSLVNRNYLTNLNTFFNEGYQAVRSRLSLQNNKGIGSVLQATANLYYNFFAGEVLFSLGASSSLSGSGMAFSVSFYKQCIKRIKSNSTDFISDLQTATIQRGRQVAFASNAIVYNTAEASYNQLIRQHAQHIHDWLFRLLSGCKMVGNGLLEGDTNRLVYGLTSLRMPLSTSIFIGAACLAVNIKIDPSTASLWAGILFLLPAYFVTAATQLPHYKQQSKTELQNSNQLVESMFTSEQESEYDAIMQTV